jgi:hypothetical protein
MATVYAWLDRKNKTVTLTDVMYLALALVKVQWGCSITRVVYNNDCN